MTGDGGGRTEQVAVARFAFRHDAEFAAGFLDDAGIPYRLQVDDPSMGLAVTDSATLWVLVEDLPDAQEILEVEDGRSGRRLVSASQPDPRSRAPTRPSSGALSSRERIVVATVGVVVVIGLINAESLPSDLRLVLGGLCGVSTFLPALLGIAPGPVKRLAAALSGSEPL